MSFTVYDMGEVKEKLEEYGVPEKLIAFGNQVIWEKKDVAEEENPLDNFMEFLESWHCTGICPSGAWGEHAEWSLFDTGLGIATVLWDYSKNGEQATEDLKNNVNLKYVYLKDNGNLSYCKTKKENKELLSIVQFDLMTDKVNWSVEFMVLKEGIYKLVEDEYCKQYKKVS